VVSVADPLWVGCASGTRCPSFCLCVMYSADKRLSEHDPSFIYRYPYPSHCMRSQSPNYDPIMGRDTAVMRLHKQCETSCWLRNSTVLSSEIMAENGMWGGNG
jgi:hypothetical protein